MQYKIYFSKIKKQFNSKTDKNAFLAYLSHT